MFQQLVQGEVATTLHDESFVGGVRCYLVETDGQLTSVEVVVRVFGMFQTFVQEVEKLLNAT